MPAVTDPQMWDMVAAALAPPERLSPSEWAAKYRRLKEGTAEQWGPWSNEYFPWLREIVDVVYDEPEKDGAIFKKAAQIGGSENGINFVGWALHQRPGPMLFLTSTDVQAKEFSRDRFSYMIDQAPVLRSRQLHDPKNRDTMHHKRFVGAKLAIWGAGSPTKLQSEPYQFVLLDEVDQLPVFPKVGSAWKLGQIRTRRYRRGFLLGWSTPTIEDGGISILYDALSDKREFYVPCPHCGTWEWLKWGQVKYENRDPATARYECEHCGEGWTDVERAHAVSQGKWRSTLPPEEASRRRYAGFHISRIYDPYIPLSLLVDSYLSCQSEADLQVFYNAELGEPYTPAARPITLADIEARGQRRSGDQVPGETRFVTAGIDVQQGEVFVVDVSAWVGHLKWVLEADVVRGFDQLEGYLRGYQANTESGPLQISMAAIDSQYMTASVYAFCKRVGIEWVMPVRYEPVPPGLFYAARKVHHANLEVMRLSRPYWMDRAHGRFTGTELTAGVILPIELANNDEYQRQVLANVRAETIDMYGKRKLTWIKPVKGAADHFIHAAGYCEFAAHWLGLDTLSDEVAKVVAERRARLAEKRPEVEQGWIRRGTKRAMRGGRWIRW